MLQPMEILPIVTPLLRPGDDLAMTLRAHADLQPGDIVVVSSKAAAVCEGSMHDLSSMQPSTTAIELSRSIKRTPAFCELVLREAKRLNGTIKRTVPGAALTEVSPKGMHGSILVANAGLDESNVPAGHAVGWPWDPIKSVRDLRMTVNASALILTDSLCLPRRLGVIAIALAVSGIDPHQSQVGRKDLFGKPLAITTEAIADQLATAANFVMGNAAQSTPAVIIRDHGLAFSDFEGWVPGMRAEEDLFGTLR
jgi:coenzyme F420-0:L-glutamate ligase